MRRLVLLLAASCIASLLVPAAAAAGTMTTDVYRSHFLARDRDGRTYSIDALVEDRPAGALLVLEIGRRCGSCRRDVYARRLEPGDLVVRQLAPASPECQCMSASVNTKFGGKDLRIEWAWDVEQGGTPAGDGYEWTAVTANNLLNVSCFGTGSVTSTPAPFSGDEPEPPRGAAGFPKKMPRAFKANILARPGCYAEGP